MTVFILDKNSLCALHALRDLAAEEYRKIPIDMVQAASKGFDPEDPSTRRVSLIPIDQTVELHLGWKVSFSIEEHPCGWCRHMSISSPAAGRIPHLNTVKMVLPELGFRLGLVELGKKGGVFKETYAENRIAINVVEPLDLETEK